MSTAPRRRAVDALGLIPAAGRATRLGRLPCSKEVYPVGLAPERVASSFALELLRRAGVARALVVLRDGKWDIPAYWLDGSAAGVDLAYVVVDDSPSVPATLDCAYPFARGENIALVFPDIVVEPRDALARVLARLQAGRAEVVLGVVPTDRPDKADMVELDRRGCLKAITIKPARTRLSQTWAVAAWRPEFSDFLHRYLARLPRTGTEIHLSTVLTAALGEGLRIEAEVFPAGSHLDLGTPEDLERMLGRRR